ncbi:MAG: thioredoxin family protein [Caldilineaceae bacterium]
MRQRIYRNHNLWLALTMTILVASLLLFPTIGAQAQTTLSTQQAVQSSHPVAIYFFWGDGCPHCAKAKPFLATLAQRYPNVEVRAYEVWCHEQNQLLFTQMAAAFGFEPSAVPTIIIGDRYWVGYTDELAVEIENAVVSCAVSGCRDAGLGVIPGIPTPVSTPVPVQEVASAAMANQAVTTPVVAATQSMVDRLSLPLIGEIDLAAQSLAVSTAVIAFVDGFNPCSVWVLSMLLALTLNTGSRRKVFLVGLVFLLVTSLVYMAFITGLFTMFSVINFVGWIQIVVALVALVFALVNIKDYFWYKSGLSLTIADEKKPSIYRGMRRVLNASESTWGMIGATVVLAAGVSLVEFSCTAGFPVVWTNLLISQQATIVTFGLLLLLYMLIYQIDELGIFLVAVFTLKSSKLEEKHGRLLKLIGGMLMLALAVVMLVHPAWMDQISSSLIVFAIAFAATGLVLLVHRTLLPQLGIRIGSELSPKPRPPAQKHKHRHA